MVKRRHGAKKLSRNKKTYWRKGTDVSVVERFIDSVREDERLGVSSKSDADLFFVQKRPSSDATDVVKFVKKVELKCFRNLKNTSAIKPLIKQIPSCKKTQVKMANKSKKEAKRLATSMKQTTKKETKSDDAYDLWETESKPTSSTVEPELEYHFRQIRQLLPKIPNSTRLLTSKLPTVELPHPGQSYNPTFDDHQTLLNTAVGAELKKLEAEEKLNRKLKVNGQLATQFSKFVELTEGLDLLKTKKEDDDDERDTDDVSNSLPSTLKIKPISAENRKLPSKRRKELMTKLAKIQRIDEKTNKKRLNDIYRLRSITKEIKAKDVAIAKKIQRHIVLKEEKMYKPAALGRHRYKEADVELHLPNEVPGSLRLMKVQGNVLEERYKSLQRRNIVDTRVFHNPTKRKYRLKKYEKRDCREVTVDYVPRH